MLSLRHSAIVCLSYLPYDSRPHNNYSTYDIVTTISRVTSRPELGLKIGKC